MVAILHRFSFTFNTRIQSRAGEAPSYFSFVRAVDESKGRDGKESGQSRPDQEPSRTRSWLRCCRSSGVHRVISGSLTLFSGGRALRGPARFRQRGRYFSRDRFPSWLAVKGFPVVPWTPQRHPAWVLRCETS